MLSRRWIWLSCFFTLLAGCASSPPPKPETKQPGNYEYTKEYIRWYVEHQMKKHGVTGLSLALIDDQRVVCAEGFGYADKAHNVPATPDTLYRAGSITKLFTATAVMQLVERGLIDLDQPVKTYLPEFSFKTRFPDTPPITIRHLLTHHSGLPRDMLRGMWSSNPKPYATVLDDLKESFVLHPPNSIFSYSNLGMTVLGQVVEQISGEPYAAYVSRALFQPLGMTTASIETGVSASPFMSHGYRKGKEATEPQLRDLPAGGLNTNVLDLARLVQMVFAQGQAGAHQVVRPETLAMMLTPQNETIPLDLDLKMGLGWVLSSLGELDLQEVGTIAHHSGGTMLFNSQLMALPEPKLGVVVLSNSSTGGAAVHQIAAELLESALEVKTGIMPKENTQLDVQPSSLSLDELAHYEGWYGTMAGLVNVTRLGETLRANITGKAFRLVPRNGQELGVEYKLLGVFPIDLGPLARVTLSRATIASRDLLLARQGSPRRMVVGERLIPVPIPPAWLQRVGTYEITNLEDEEKYTDQIRLSYQEGFLVVSTRVTKPTPFELTYALDPISDTEATVMGIGPWGGETLEVIRQSGEELGRFSGYLLKRTSTQ